MKIGTIILAAGKGTRMKAERPKVIFELASKPMINWVVDTAKKINSDIISIVVGYKKEMVMDCIDPVENITYVEQIEQKGTGHAVMVCSDVFKEFEGTVFILCGDVPLLRYQTLQKMLKIHLEEKAECTVLTAVMDDPAMYGRILRNTDRSVKKIVEFKDASATEREVNEINTGIYCFESKSLFSALDRIDNSNNQNEFYLTDTLEILNKMGKKVISVLLDDMVEATGINSRDQLLELEQHYFSRKRHFTK